MAGHLIPDHRVRTSVITLAFASVLGLLMLAGRALVVEQMGFMALIQRAIALERIELDFYVWNLTLAWLPLVFALGVYRLARTHTARWWLVAFYAVLWFLFFPNAPYIVTDFLHLGHLKAPKWFDIVLMMTFAWIGLLLGYLSLMLMQEIVRARSGTVWSWCFAVVMLALGSVGIYLGRFDRWNSWDVATDPFGILRDVLNRFDLQTNRELFEFLLTFFCFSVLSYTTLHALTHLRLLPTGGEGGKAEQEKMTHDE